MVTKKIFEMSYFVTLATTIIFILCLTLFVNAEKRREVFVKTADATGQGIAYFKVKKWFVIVPYHVVAIPGNSGGARRKLHDTIRVVDAEGLEHKASIYQACRQNIDLSVYVVDDDMRCPLTELQEKPFLKKFVEKNDKNAVVITRSANGSYKPCPVEITGYSRNDLVLNIRSTDENRPLKPGMSGSSLYIGNEYIGMLDSTYFPDDDVHSRNPYGIVFDVNYLYRNTVLPEGYSDPISRCGILYGGNFLLFRNDLLNDYTTPGFGITEVTGAKSSVIMPVYSGFDWFKKIDRWVDDRFWFKGSINYIQSGICVSWIPHPLETASDASVMEYSTRTTTSGITKLSYCFQIAEIDAGIQYDLIRNAHLNFSFGISVDIGGARYTTIEYDSTLSSTLFLAGLGNQFYGRKQSITQIRRRSILYGVVTGAKSELVVHRNINERSGLYFEIPVTWHFIPFLKGKSRKEQRTDFSQFSGDITFTDSTIVSSPRVENAEMRYGRFLENRSLHRIVYNNTEVEKPFKNDENAKMALLNFIEAALRVGIFIQF